MRLRPITRAECRSARSTMHSLEAGCSVNEYSAAMYRAVADGWMEAHPLGAYVKLTQAGAEKFA